MSAVRHRPAQLVLITVAVSLLAAFFTVAGSQRSDAVDPAEFDPSMIISDSIFYDSSTMSASDIQVFLDQKGAGCVPGSDGTPCLKDFRQDTVSRAATDRCPGGYVGAANEPAATIIAKVAASCGINPQVILVTLQKEQGLVRGSGSARWATAAPTPRPATRSTTGSSTRCTPPAPSSGTTR
jgi:hypothetical protein